MQLIEWNEQEVERLKGFLSIGKLGMREIAAELGRTKNSVVSKVHRLGLARYIQKPEIKSVEVKRRAPSGTDGQAKRALWRIRAKKAGNIAPDKPLAAPRAVDVTPAHISLFDTTAKTCKFPYGDGPFTFCGCEVANNGSPYCEHHRLVCSGGKPQLTDTENVSMIERVSA